MRKLTVTGANTVFFVFTMAFVVWQVIIGVLTAIFGNDFLPNNIYGILLVNQYVLILIPVLAYAFINKINIKETFRFKSPGLLPSILVILMAFPAYFVAVTLNSIVLYILQKIADYPSESIIRTPETVLQLAIAILVIAVSPGLCEEFLHRGLLLRAYEKRGSMKAVVITAIIFGFFHFDISNLMGPIFLGLLIGYYVIKTNSILAGMLAHFLNNAIAILLQFVTYKYSQTGNTEAVEQVGIQLADLAGIIVIGLIAAILLGALLSVFRGVTQGEYEPVKPISTVKEDLVSIFSHWPIIVVSALYLLIVGGMLLLLIMTKVNNLLG